MVTLSACTARLENSLVHQNIAKARYLKTDVEDVAGESVFGKLSGGMSIQCFSDGDIISMTGGQSIVKDGANADARPICASTASYRFRAGTPPPSDLRNRHPPPVFQRLDPFVFSIRSFEKTDTLA